MPTNEATTSNSANSADPMDTETDDKPEVSDQLDDDSSDNVELRSSVTDSMKDILVNLTDDGLDKLWQLLPSLSEAEVNFRDKNGNGWLHWLAVAKNARNVDQNRLVGLAHAFSAAGINYNMRNRTRNSALHFAVACSAPLRFINALLKMGIDPTFVNDKGRRAAQCTSSRSTLKTLELFTPPLDEAIRQGDVEQVHRLASYWVRIANYHLDLARRNEEIRLFLESRQPVLQLIHRCLAGDIRALNEALDSNPELQLDNTDESYINDEGRCLRLPLMYQLVSCPYTYPVAELLLERTRPDVTFPVKFKADGKMVPFWISFKSSSHPEKAVLMPLIQSCVDYQASLSALDHATMLEFLTEIPDTFVQLVRMGYEFWQPDAYLRNLKDHAALHELQQLESLDPAVVLDGVKRLDETLMPCIRSWTVDELMVCMKSGYWPCLSFKAIQQLRASSDADDRQFLERVDKVHAIWLQYRRLRQLICQGNTIGFRDALTEELCDITDKKSHSLAHWAVIFERRFILKLVLEKCSTDCVHLVDYSNRTALDYSQGADEKFMYQNLLKAGAASNEQAKSSSTGTATPHQADDSTATRAYYRQAIRAERRDPACFAHSLLLLHLNLQDAVLRNCAIDVEHLLEAAWPDMPICLLDQLNRIFPRQPHRFPSLIALCIDEAREEIGCRLLAAGVPAPADPISTTDGIAKRLEERARESGLNRLADEIVRLRQAAAAAGGGTAVRLPGDFADEVGTILSVDTEDTFAVPAAKSKQKRQQPGQGGGGKSRGGKKAAAGKGKTDGGPGSSEVCAVL